MTWIAILIGLLIIAGLSYYAGKLLAELRVQRRRRNAAIGSRNDNLYESIYTIALAMQQGQCDLSEGSLRIAVLLDHLSLHQTHDFVADYPGIHDMYERIKHMPTHEARKEFPKPEIKRMDAEREGYEVELESVIQTDVDKLLKWIRTQRD